ncbi:hypothetical protein [Paraburkholderia fungorum]|uniref:hypothetical protein n=1 Tax=Paraburkholderia fungorum TaxID=134537 RepID=UPI001C1ED36B|nr:hypothetical protein [Paraburkholderia fungorum]MBU7442158.1 hypothetical protein [Paraburkholderia fungorum]
MAISECETVMPLYFRACRNNKQSFDLQKSEVSYHITGCNMDFLKTLIKGPFQIALVVLGAICVVLGSGTFAKLPIIGEFQPTAPGFLRVFGSLLVIGGFLYAAIRVYTHWAELKQRRANSAARAPSLPKAADYEIRIVHPSDGDDVIGGGPHKIRGTIKRTLPDQYTLWLVRRWHSRQDDFYPEGKAKLKPVPGSTTEHTWEVDGVFIGGNPGDRRIIEMWIVGPDGQILLEATMKAYGQHSDLMETTKTPWSDPWLQVPLKQTTADMIRGPQITVIRR